MQASEIVERLMAEPTDEMCFAGMKAWDQTTATGERSWLKVLPEVFKAMRDAALSTPPKGETDADK